MSERRRTMGREGGGGDDPQTIQQNATQYSKTNQSRHPPNAPGCKMQIEQNRRNGGIRSRVNENGSQAPLQKAALGKRQRDRPRRTGNSLYPGNRSSELSCRTDSEPPFLSRPFPSPPLSPPLCLSVSRFSYSSAASFRFLFLPVAIIRLE